MTAIIDVTEDGRWILTCGCGNEIRQKDLVYVSSSPSPCDFCREVLAGEDDSFGPPSVSHELGWCGCGNPELIDELMLRYLRSLPVWDHPDHGIPEGERLLLAYIADAQQWTEHGGSVGGAWITPEGEAVRDRLAEIVARST